jgi:protein TonB
MMRDVGQALPSILEVRLVAASPAPSLAPAKPSPAQPPRPSKRPQVAPAAPLSTPVAAVAPSPLPSAAAPAQTQTADANPAPRVAPNPEPTAVTPPDLRAAYLSNPRPPYPLAARRLGLVGRVTLRAEILENGNCGRIAVSHSSGHDMLDQAALQAVKQWHFVPAQRGGEAVAAWVEVPIVFRLEEAGRG